MSGILDSQPVLFRFNIPEVFPVYVLVSQNRIEMDELNGSVIRQSRPDGQDDLFLRCVQAGVFFNLRTRPNEAHVAEKDIKELRQFIQFVLPQEAPDPCNAWIIQGC